jgi:glutathione synthase
MHQPRRFLFVMDPFETLNLATETSLLFMEELLARGHEVLWAEVDGLILRQNKLFASSKTITSLDPIAFEAPEEIAVDNLDAVFVRPDPPFSSNYLHLTYLLDFISPDVLQLNPGAALRNFNEKLSTLNFAAHAPDTLTTQNHAALMAFLEKHGEIVIKPLDECSGRGIKRLSATSPDASEQLCALLKDTQGKTRFVTAQEFLKDVAEGDKRVYLVGGEPVGLVNRIPREGGWLGNIHQGARCVKTQLTAQENAAIAAIKPFLADNGIILVGLDLIGGKITEINITSPSAVRQINEVTGNQIHKTIIGLILRQLEGIPAPKRAATAI